MVLGPFVSFCASYAGSIDRMSGPIGSSAQQSLFGHCHAAVLFIHGSGKQISNESISRPPRWCFHPASPMMEEIRHIRLIFKRTFLLPTDVGFLLQQVRCDPVGRATKLRLPTSTETSTETSDTISHGYKQTPTANPMQILYVYIFSYLQNPQGLLPTLRRSPYLAVNHSASLAQTS